MTIGKAIERYRRALLISVGAFAGLGVLAFMATQSVPWGPPGTEAYSRYETANRVVGLPWLACVAVLAMLLRDPPRLGVAVTLLGAISIVVGSSAEFWFLTDVSYRDPLRVTAWMSFLAGHPLFVIGYVVAWRQPGNGHRSV